MAAGYRRSIAASIQDPPAAYGNLPGSAKVANACTHSWTDERRQTAFTMWKEGIPASEIAKKLGGVTRNAVIGVVTRAGLGRPKPSGPGRVHRVPKPPRLRVVAEGPHPWASGRKKQPMPKAKGFVLPSYGGSTQLSPTELAVSAAQANAAAKRATADEAPALIGLRTMETLRKFECRWPLGDPQRADFTFCGKAGCVGSYCGEHTALAYQPLPQKGKRTPAAELARSLRRYV